MLPAQALFVEAGHGKSPSGKRDPGAVVEIDGRVITERSITVDLAGRVLDLLQRKQRRGGKTILQGVGIDTEADVKKKIRFVNDVIRKNKLNPKLCFGIAIHTNSGSPENSGILSYYQPRVPQSKDFAEYVCQSVLEYTQLPLLNPYLRPSTTSRFKRLYIDDALCPYILLETGFLTNPVDLSFFTENPVRVAEGIAHGVLEYLRNH